MDYAHKRKWTDTESRRDPANVSYSSVPHYFTHEELVSVNLFPKTKASGLFRNRERMGAEWFARIRSVIDATLKNGQDIFFALKFMGLIFKSRRLLSNCDFLMISSSIFLR